MPATRTLPGIDRGQPARRRHAAGGHLRPRLAATRALQHRWQIAHEGEARQETQHVDLIATTRVQPHHLGGAETAGRGHSVEVRPAGRELVTVIDGQLPHPPPRRSDRRRTPQRGVDRRFDSRACAAQRIVDHRQRAEGRYRLDDPGQLATGKRLQQRLVGCRDFGQQAAIDGITELDGQRGIAEGKDTVAQPGSRLPCRPLHGPLRGSRRRHGSWANGVGPAVGGFIKAQAFEPQPVTVGITIDRIENRERRADQILGGRYAIENDRLVLRQ